MNETKKKWDRKYIKQDNFSLAEDLAQKHYYLELKPIFEMHLKELKHLLKHYHPERTAEIYDQLSVERKKLIKPIRGSREEMIQKWKEEIYEKNTFYPEGLKYETQQGELVRSKSEVIIANLLYQHRDEIMYKYERPLKVKNLGKMITIYPDFTIINLHSGKITYWEHAGLMDNYNYANDFVRKINIYTNNNFMVGKELVITYETTENPLDLRVIKKQIEMITKLD